MTAKRFKSITLQQMEAVISLVEEGSFSRAAKRMFLTQPALTKNIKNAEDYLSVRLVNRSNMGTSLTPEGKILYNYAQRMVKLRDEAREKILTLRENVGGNITTAQPVVGIVPGGTPPEVNAIVMNKDIGYVKEEQSCVIKVDTFDYQKYGTIEGKVEVVNLYGMEDEERNKDMEKESGGYPVRVKMLAETLKTKNGDVYNVKPGMSVAAEVNIGKRRVIEFFLFPIIRYLDEGLKVR